MIKENYPENFEEFIDRFSTEKDCINYISEVRWPSGFSCPHCNNKKAWITNRGLYHCSNCRKDTSITAGTIFQGTQKPLRLWFHVMWLMMAQKTGVSALNLKDNMGFGSYQTIWGWLHKLRSVMVCANRDLLKGAIEVDETYIGGQKSGKRGRGSEGKALVVVAVEGTEYIDKDGKEKKTLDRVRFRCIEDASSENLIPFICDNVKKKSKIITDGWSGYNKIKTKNYIHEKIVDIGDSEVLPHVHLVISLLKKWLQGTHQGSIKQQHLQLYLDEFSFRFNRRLSTHRGKLFFRLMQQAVTNQAPGIKELYKM